MSPRINPKGYGPPPVQAELPMIAAPPSVPPTAELVTKAQLVARHPHLLSANRVTWALEGFDALADQRAGKRPLRRHLVKPRRAPRIV